MIRSPAIRQRRFSARARLLTAAVAACYAATPVWALPTAPVVANGSASFAQNGNVLNVTNSNGAIINWNTFNIGANETTRFIQSSASSAVLNRVVTADPSLIYGTLSSNGRVWLVNPGGIMVGPGGRIDTAGFIASTLNISDQNFLAGRLNFQNTPGAGNVVNQGAITTPSGGSVYLVGANVSNEGIITTPGGETLLAAGQTVNLIDTATPGVKVEITGADGNATNLGQIVADAGRIGIAGVIVKNAGALSASSVVNEGGRIFLKASKDAYVDGAGRIVATGTTGGKVEVLGDRVAVMGNASIDASGVNGGGTVLVGGDYQGKNPAVQNASIAYLGPQASLRADATTSGDGGKVIVWADDTTRAYGTISARGGAASGNGGFVETSGHSYLDVVGARVDTRASHGTTGTWLLDPTDITIFDGAAGSSSAVYGSVTNPPYPDNGTAFFDSGANSAATVADGDINANLVTTNVMVTTQSGNVYGSGNIVIDSSVNIANTSGASRNLWLHADNAINMQYGATITGNSSSPLSVFMEAYGGTPSITLSGTIRSFGGDVMLRAMNGVTIGDPTNTYSGAGLIDTGISATHAKIYIDAGNNGLFRLAYGGKLMSDSGMHMLQANVYGGVSPTGKVAIGIRAADVQIDSTSNGIVSGATYGGDIGFLPSYYAGSVNVGAYGGGGGFWLDQAEIGKISQQASNSTLCQTTGKDGCGIWIGNLDPVGTLGYSTDLSGTTLQPSSGAIKLGEANFGTTRVYVSTQGVIDAYGGGGYGGYDIRAAHANLTGYGGIGTSSGAAGLRTELSSLAAHTQYGASGANIVITDVTNGGSALTLRDIGSHGTVTIKAPNRSVQIVPYYADQSIEVYGGLTLTAGGGVTAAYYGGTYTVGSTSQTAAADAVLKVNGNLDIAAYGGNIDLRSATAYGGAVVGGNLNFYASGDISLTDAVVESFGDVAVRAAGNLSLTGINNGALIESHYGMTIDVGGSLTLTGSTVATAYGSNVLNDPLHGAGAGLRNIGTTGDQVVTVVGDIVMTAGGVNNGLVYGSSAYGGSAGISNWAAGAAQTVSAHSIALYGGTGGHDNVAHIEAKGPQTININGGQIYMKGGADGAGSVYGGGGSFRNEARIGQNNSGSPQTVVVYGGGSILMYGGSASGTLGWNGGSSSGARIGNYGGSTQIIDFYGSSQGTLTLYGGSAGTDNRAGIEGGYGDQWIGNSYGGAAPNIGLFGGSGGGSAGHENGAGIEIKELLAGNQIIYANNITLEGGAAPYGGAGFSGEDIAITTTGGLSMTGGSGAGYDTVKGIPGSAVYIGSEYGASVTLNIGGNLTVLGGSGYGGMAMIGSLKEQAIVNIAAGGNVSITGGGAGAGKVGIGSMAVSTYGATVSILAGRDLGIYGGTAGIRIGAQYGSNADHTYLGAGAATDIDSPSGYGGSVNTTGNVRVDSAGDIAIKAYSANTSPYGGGNINLGAGGNLYGADILVIANGDAVVGGTVNSPGTVTLKSGYDGAAFVATRRSFEIAGDVYGGTVDVHASGAILDSLTNGTVQGNVIATNASFTSYYGGSAGGLAISADTRVTGSLTASVGSGATYGGIRIDNVGAAAPNTVALHDYTPNVSSTVHFGHSGSNLNSNMMFAAYGDIALQANSVTGYGANIDSSHGNVEMTVANDIKWNDGSAIKAGKDVKLTLNGLNSKLYLNDAPGYASPSYILAGLPTTIHLSFPHRLTAGGVVIDGVATTTSLPGGSGLFVVGHDNPATAGAGLSLTYDTVVSTPSPAVVDVIVSTINTATTNSVTSNTSTTSPTMTNIPPPAPPSSGTGVNLASLGSQTTGGGTGQFGGSDTSASLGTSSGSGFSSGTGTNGTAGGTSTSDSGSGTTSGSSPASGEGSKSASSDSKDSGTKDNGKDSGKDTKESKDDKKDDKKGDKKDDKKSADSSEDKKDDKASGKKPVGKCSA